MLCNHEWKQIGMPQHLKYDYSGNEVVLIRCRCDKCGKEKDKQFHGHTIGNLLDRK